ncbi:MAG TPA: hypothetical protein VEJ23_07675 [Solirubrobacteraceae bacterium]|nr:hypothetical protein [Solirubrobacteraceae bacterium]
MTAIDRVRALALAACLPVCLWAAPAAASTVRRARALATTPAQPIATATLTQCVTTGAESERSLTVAAQMTLVAGSSRMQTRTYLVQRRSGETQFRMISAPGLGAWLEAEAGVKTYKDLRQVTNLAPAVYRAVVDFRWLNAHSHVVKRLQLDTSKCAQPAVSATAGPSAP